MPSTVKKTSRNTRSKVGYTARRNVETNVASTIRRSGDEWARHWNAGELEGVVAVNAKDTPLSHGVSDLAFAVTYIKQQGTIAWDVGTYRVTIPQNDGTKREDHGKYLTVWRRAGKNWFIVADAWWSDLPPSA